VWQMFWVSILSACQGTCLFLFFCCANLIVCFVQELYCLPEGVSEDNARYQTITYYYRHDLRQPMYIEIAKDFHLTNEKYLLGKVDWLVKNAEAWDSLCEWLASLDFRARFDRARVNWMSKRVVQHYIADGHV
jgi:hypothetical protein